MAFAPPRRMFANRTAEQRKRSDSKEKTSTSENKTAQKIRNVIEARNREWLAIDRSPKSEFPPADDESRVPKPSFLRRETELLLEDMEMAQTLRVDPPEALRAPEVPRPFNSDANNHRNGRETPPESADFPAMKGEGRVKAAAKAVRAASEEGEPGVRKEVRRRKGDVGDQAQQKAHVLDRGKRPESHYCPVCERLMSLRGCEPVCIIPCGHSLCEGCSKALQRECPICGHGIQTTTHNVILKRIIETFSQEHEAPLPSVSAAASGRSQAAGRRRDAAKNADLEKWSEELSAVEMRLSVLELQAEQTSATIVKSRTRMAENMNSLVALETKEHELLEQLRSTQMQLREVETERVKITNQMKADEMETEKCCEQLNLINYTKAGLETEMEKLRLLCNRT